MILSHAELERIIRGYHFDSGSVSGPETLQVLRPPVPIGLSAIAGTDHRHIQKISGVERYTRLPSSSEARCRRAVPLKDAYGPCTAPDYYRLQLSIGTHKNSTRARPYSNYFRIDAAYVFVVDAPLRLQGTGMTGWMGKFVGVGVLSLVIIFCGPATPEEISTWDADTAALDKACELWTKKIHIGTKYRSGLGEDMAFNRNTFIFSVFIPGRKKLLLESDGRIASATCG